MKIKTASIVELVLRYYIMMTIVIVSFMIGYPVLAVLAVPVFLSALAGISIEID